MAKKASNLLKSVPTPVVFGLCALTFLCGRYVTSFERFSEFGPELEEGQGSLQVIRPEGASPQEGQPPQVDLPPLLSPGESGNAFYTNAPFQILSWYPRVVVYPNFIDKERCNHIINIAKQRLRPSSVALRKGDSYEGTKDVRTSSGTFMDSSEDPAGVLKWLEDKIAQVTLIPAGHGEPFNVLRYNLNQRYESHFDVFDPESYGPQPSTRIATVLTYLSDVEEGGETVFLLEGKDGTSRLNGPGFSYKDCSTGLVYKPRMGDALLFYSQSVNGTFDRHALHGGCPVKVGEKWVMTKWIRDKCQRGDCM